MFLYSYRNNDPSLKIKAEVIGFYSKTKCYLWSRSAQANEFTRKDQVQLTGRAAWGWPSVRKPLRPGWGSVTLPHTRGRVAWSQGVWLPFPRRHSSLSARSTPQEPSWPQVSSCVTALQRSSAFHTEEKLFLKNRHHFSPMALLKQFTLSYWVK